jgi:hypothetical protein
MINKLTLSKENSFIRITQEYPFEKLTIVSARQMQGVMRDYSANDKPKIIVAVTDGYQTMTSFMLFKPLTKEFGVYDFLGNIRKFKKITESRYHTLEISINQNYFESNFSIELEFDIL